MCEFVCAHFIIICNTHACLVPSQGEDGLPGPPGPPGKEGKRVSKQEQITPCMVDFMVLTLCGIVFDIAVSRS